MVYFLTLLSCLVGSGILVGLKILFAFELTSFSLFFVVPVGAIVSGGAICSGYPFGIKKFNIKPSKRQVAIVLLLTALMFFVVQYGYYMVTYVDEDYNYNYRFQGDHVSEYYFIDTDEQINFFNFLVDSINTQIITFYSRSNTQEIEGNKAVNWIFFAIDFIGFIFGGFFVYGYVIGSEIYCDKCSKYMKKKGLMRFTENIQERLSVVKECIENKDISKLKEIVKSNTTEQKPEDFYVDSVLYYCEDCNDGFLFFEFYVKTKKDKYEHDDKRSIKVKLDNEIVKNLL